MAATAAASSSSFHSILFLSLLLIASAVARSTFHPKALVIPVKKDLSTLQYIIHIWQRTPLISLSLTLDLGGRHLWMECEQGYVSATYRSAPCPSAQCSLGGPQVCGTCIDFSPKLGCHNNTCQAFTDNTWSNNALNAGELGSDVVSIQSTDGKNPGRSSSVPQFLFVCAPSFLLEGLASGVKGMAGLGRTRLSLPSQFSSAFSFHRKFAICLTSTNSNGVVFFGDGPYVFLPGYDASSSLTYTPLILNPVSTALMYPKGEASSDYFIGVKSIKINEKTVPINKTLLSINNKGYGGTKISTVNPYTVMETSIYKAVTEFFIQELANVPRVASISPFGVCYNSKNLVSTRLGPAVPSIDLVLQSESVYWRIVGANSMVQVSNEVSCLGFVDGGVQPRTSIVIGGHQIEDNFLHFDLAASRLGFSSSLLSRQTNCANFNFTSNA